MNSTFKVVFNKARGALMVVNEVTSSVQAKGTKTVIAAAVASLIAGSAIAAGSTPVTIKDGSLTVTNSTTYTHSGAGVKVGTTEWADATNILGSDSVVTMDNGVLNIIASGAAAANEVSSLLGTGVLNVTGANKTTSAGTASNADFTADVLHVSAGNEDKASDLTVNLSAVGVPVAAGAATVSLHVTQGILGNVADASQHIGATAVTLNVAENTNAVVDTAAATLKLDNVVFGDNAGKLTFNADTSNASDADKIELNSVMDVAGKTGAYVFADATDVKKSVTADSVYVGALIGEDKASVQFAEGAKITGTYTPEQGTTAAITKVTTVKAGSLKVNAKTLTAGEYSDLQVTGDTAIVSGGAVSIDANAKATFTGTVTVDGSTSTVAVASSGAATFVGDVTVKDGTLTQSGSGTFGKLTLLKGTNHKLGGETTVDTLVVGTTATTGAETTVTIDGALKAGSVSAQGYTSSTKGTVEVNAAAKNVSVDTITVGQHGVFTLTDAGTFKAGTVTVGGATSADAAFAIAGGTENVIDSLTINKNSTNAISAGKTSIKSLTMAAGTTMTADGTADVTIGTFAGEGVYDQSAGKLTTDYANIVTKLTKAETGDTYTATISTKLKATGSTALDLTGGDKYTLEQYNAINTAVTATGTLRLIEAQFVDYDANGKQINEKWEHVDDIGYYAGTSTIDATADQVQTVAAETTIGVLNIVTSATTDQTDAVSIGGTEALTLRGNGSEFLTFGDHVKPEKVTLNNVFLGEKATDAGTYNGVVNVDTSKTLTVAAGNFTLKDVAGEGAVDVNGGNLTLLGTVKEQVYRPAGATADSKYSVLTFGQNTYGTGATPTNNPYTGDLTVQGGSFLALGNYSAQAAEALAEATAIVTEEDEDAKANIIYVGEQIYLNKAPKFANNLSESNFVVIDLGSVAANAAYDKTQAIVGGEETVASFTNVDKVVVDNLNAGVVTQDDEGVVKTINLGKTLQTAEVELGGDFLSDYGLIGDLYVTGEENGSIRVNTVGNVTFKTNTVALERLKTLGLNSYGALVRSLETVTFGQNLFVDALFDGNDALEAYLDSREEAWDAIVAAYAEEKGLTIAGAEAALADEDKQFARATLAQIVRDENAGTNMAALGGAFTTALDVNDQVTGAISRRTSLANLNVSRADVGMTPWVDVIGSKNEAKRLYGNNAGYEADIFGAVLGFDYTAACGGVLGVAVNVGQADGNSVGNGSKIDNDADFYGFSVYGAKQFGDVNVKADIGYTNVSNDLSTNGVFGNIKESLDAGVFTFGVGAEYLVKASSVNVVPHAGIRVSRIDMDDSKYGADYDAMTVYQMPLGVAFSGNFETAGWTIAPMVDISVVPAFGDKDAVATYIGGNTVTTRVVDTNPVQATLGVSAQTGAWTFGINYSLTAGSDDRMNNALNANVRYTF